jgi:hypothetical protein
MVNLGAGTITGRDAASTAVVGADTLRSIESVRGSNAADIFDASTFTATSTNGGGDQGTFNEFEGMGGGDQIIGNGNTRISYVNATSAVTVTMTSLGAGAADGDGSVGHDTFSGVNSIRGSNFNDTLTGSNNGNNTVESFDGWSGDDLMIGGGGFDRARYDTNSTVNTGIPLVLGIRVDMATGIVTGLDDYATSVFGTDTLRGIEAVRGSSADDVYVATGYTGSTVAMPSANAGESGGTTNGFNEFEGVGGNDQVTGNNNTRLSYSVALDGVNVTISGAGSGSDIGRAAGDVAGVGGDAFTGVNAVRGSQFDDIIAVTGGAGFNYNLDGQAGSDTINGGSGNDVITGGAGNDTIDGGGGLDVAEFSGLKSDYAIAGGSTPGSSTVTDSVSGRDGADTLTTVELMEFANAYAMNQRNLDVSTFGLTAGKQIFGTNNNLGGVGDNLTIGTNANGRLIDLAGGGTDTLTLANGGGTFNLNLANVEAVAGGTGNDVVSLQNAVSGLSINLGGGIDTLNLAGGGNTITEQNVETINGGGGIDTVTMAAAGTAAMNSVENIIGSAGIDNVTFSGASTITNVESIHGSAGFDTLTLGSSGAVTVNAVETITGTASADQVTINADPGVLTVNATIDLGLGTDSVALAFAGAGSVANLALTSVETLTSASGVGTINLQNAASGMTIDTGAAGFNTVNLGNGNNTVTIYNAATINAFGAHDDNVTAYLNTSQVNQSINLGFGTDTLTLAGSNGDFNISVLGGNLTVIGATDAVNEHINLLNVQVSPSTFDLGAGTDDSLTLSGQSGFFNNVTVRNVETVTGSSFADTIIIANTSGTATVTAGWDGDNITASAGVDHIRYASVADSQFVLGGAHDIVTNFNAANDAFVFDAAVGLHGMISFIDSDEFAGNGVSQARLDTSGMQPMLQIDVDGDGQMTANDMLIELHNQTGVLHSSNFLLG